MRNDGERAPSGDFCGYAHEGCRIPENPRRTRREAQAVPTRGGRRNERDFPASRL
jgi:hypothetical protein